MPNWMFKEESNREETKKRDPKNDNHASQDVQEGTMKGKCVAGPVLLRAQAR